MSKPLHNWTTKINNLYLLKAIKGWEPLEKHAQSTKWRDLLCEVTAGKILTKLLFHAVAKTG